MPGTCLKTADNSCLERSGKFLFGNRKPDKDSRAAIFIRQFITQNNDIFQAYEVMPELVYDGRTVHITFRTGDTIGAFPLRSPSTGRYDYGMIIKPRFDWAGIGPMLGAMGWKVVPELQALPMLPSSAREIPRWVMSSVIIHRLEYLIHHLVRRFESVERELSAPRGKVNWTVYAAKKVPRMQFLNVPCRFSELRADQQMLSAIHYVLRQQISALNAQKGQGGTAALSLIKKCEELKRAVQDVPPREPTPRMLQMWISGRQTNKLVHQGIEAIEWSIENRGLAGLSPLQGLPWKLYMPDFFEAWVETLARKLVVEIGGTVRAGRTHDTVVPISWDFSSGPTQRSLKPDVVIERNNEIVIIDAKYKTHWHEILWQRRSSESESTCEQHRQDLLQVLAYSSLFTADKLTVCLLYPCYHSTWTELKEKERIHRHGSIYAGSRQINIILSAVPMGGSLSDVTQRLSETLRASNN